MSRQKKRIGVFLSLFVLLLALPVAGGAWTPQAGYYRGVYIGGDYGVLHLQLFEDGSLGGEGVSASREVSFALQGDWTLEGECRFEGEEGRHFEGRLDEFGRLLGQWRWGELKGSFSALAQ